MRADDKTAAELELEQHLRAEQDANALLRRQLNGQRLDVNILFLVSLSLMAVVVVLGLALDSAGTRVEWSTRRGDFFRDEAARLLSDRDACWEALDICVGRMR